MGRKLLAESSAQAGQTIDQILLVLNVDNVKMTSFTGKVRGPWVSACACAFVCA